MRAISVEAVSQRYMHDVRQALPGRTPHKKVIPATTAGITVLGFLRKGFFSNSITRWVATFTNNERFKDKTLKCA